LPLEYHKFSDFYNRAREINCCKFKVSFIRFSFQTIGHVSGGHLNPAVTVGLLAAGKVSLIRAIFYIIAQCVGSVAGTASLSVLINGTEFDSSIGHTQLKPELSVFQGLGFEFFLGFILIFCVFGVCDDNKPDSRFMAPLAIGLTVTLGHLGVVAYTGK
jgi:aquaporin related protein